MPEPISPDSRKISEPIPPVEAKDQTLEQHAALRELEPPKTADDMQEVFDEIPQIPNVPQAEPSSQGSEEIMHLAGLDWQRQHQDISEIGAQENPSITSSAIAEQKIIASFEYKRSQNKKE